MRGKYIWKAENCDCGISEDGLALICEKHYSEYMEFQMQSPLLTSVGLGRRIWHRLKVGLIPPGKGEKN